MKTARATVVGLLLFMVALPIHAGVVAPELESILQTAAPEDRIPVIVILSDRVDIKRFDERNKKIRRARMIRALKQRFEDNMNRSSLRTLVQRLGRAGRVRPLWIINGLALEARANLIRQMAAKPWVEIIKLDETVYAPETATTFSAVPEWNITGIGAPEVWSLGYTGQNVVVASMDTGVDVDHPDLSGRWRGGTNSWFDANDSVFDPNVNNLPYDSDPYGHGTGVMGIMVGGDAGGSSIGVAPGARWIAVKIFDEFGIALESEIHAGFQWLLDPDGNPNTDDPPDIVNNSWGYDALVNRCFDGSTEGISFRADIQILKQAGIAVVFAGGNAGGAAYTSVSPANYPESFAVGSVDATNAVSSFSSRGPSACDGGIYPDIVAPGGTPGIRTADLSFGGVIPNSYAYVTGTSFAAPHAAATMALLLSAYPDLTPYQLETALKAAANRHFADPDNDYGYGLIDALAAYQAVPQFDSVEITNLIYDPSAQSLTVVAVSSDQPNVALTAEGFGPLNWKSWLNFYRNTFYNVSAPPSKVTVNSTGGGTAARSVFDTVTITNLAYDEAAQTLTVVATSSDQPNVNLTAQDFGPLAWKSWKNFYRSTFTGVESNPGMVTVVSSAGGTDTLAVPAPALDTVTIIDLSYDETAQSLTVVATSSNQPDVNLTAEGFGPLAWKSWKNFYRSTFTGVALNPETVTVTSSAGGTDTLAVPSPGPDTVTITQLNYDAAAQTLMVVATSSDQPNVNLTAEGIGSLAWKSWKNFYRSTFTSVASNPGTVTVTSSAGGSDTWNLGGTITTVATSTTIRLQQRQQRQALLFSEIDPTL